MHPIFIYTSGLLTTGCYVYDHRRKRERKALNGFAIAKDIKQVSTTHYDKTTSEKKKATAVFFQYWRTERIQVEPLFQQRQDSDYLEQPLRMPDEKRHPLVQFFKVPLQVTRSHLIKRDKRQTKNESRRKSRNPGCTSGPHILWPDDVWRKHCGQIDGGHFIDVLIARGVMQQVEQQLQKAAVGRRQQHEKQLKRFNLTILVRSVCLVPFLIKAGELWSQHMKRFIKNE